MISITASILTVTIAAIVAFIAWLQWRTADEKVVLDLFDKRFAVYEELRNGIYPARSGDQNAVLGFKVATLRAQFLFGAEVTTFLEATASDLAEAMVKSKSSPLPSPEHSEAALARANRLNAFFGKLDTLVVPYMKHHRKVPISIYDRCRRCTTKPLGLVEQPKA
jgi:hypothetical protein